MERFEKVLPQPHIHVHKKNSDVKTELEKGAMPQLVLEGIMMMHNWTLNPENDNRHIQMTFIILFFLKAKEF